MIAPAPVGFFVSLVMAAPCHGPRDKASGFGRASAPLHFGKARFGKARFGKDRPAAGLMVHNGTSLMRDSPFKPAARVKALKWHGD
ncbi:hypothetical protein SBA_ch1_20740 [Sphingomonas bisphenolicum]|uniref:Uncharacterized protein n=1 Tax=Sphingomonas bisphenolicum TaxID=296544 RepID=A0ABM7G4E9_9SPHN|nr:hypothetical protein SBA_ch1_20740 [Sphingomonas bisphenolicum]